MCYGRRVGCLGFPFPVAPIAIMVSFSRACHIVLVRQSREFGTAPIMTAPTKQSLSLRGRCSTDSRVTRHRQIAIHGCVVWRKAHLGAGRADRGADPTPVWGCQGFPTSPPTMQRRRWTPAPPCAHCTLSIFPSGQVCHLTSTTRTPQHQNDITLQIAAGETRCWLAFPVDF